MVNIHDFAAIPATRSFCFYTPEFSCNGHQWYLQIYPGGCNVSVCDGLMAVFLGKRSQGGISATFEMEILNKFGGRHYYFPQVTEFYPLDGDTLYTRGYPNFCTRSEILDLSQNILDNNGTMSVVISIKEQPSALKPFIPKNPCQNMLQKKFLDEETSGVCFEVSSSDSKNDR